MGLLGHGHGFETALGVATDLCGAHFGIRHVGDAQGHDPVRIGGVPVLEEPIVPRPGAGDAEFAVVDQAEERAAEARYTGRKIHRRLNAPDIHVLDAIVDAIAARPHLVETRGLHPVVLLGPPRHAHETHLEIGLAIHHPDLVPLLGLHHLGPAILELRGQPSLEGFRGLHQVIVHRDQRVLGLPRLGVGKERPRRGALDPEFDDIHHDSAPSISSEVQASPASGPEIKISIRATRPGPRRPGAAPDPNCPRRG